MIRVIPIFAGFFKLRPEIILAHFDMRF
jgi:hypothetical protein